MKQSKTKKGFTIVELVIVIAVIAILAAVLIPTFKSIIKKANVSKDTQLIRNLNTALATDTALNGKHDTMYDALQAAKAAGYEIEKINASATQNEILWDSVNDVFCYLNKEKVEYIPDTKIDTNDIKAYQYWQIVDAVPATQKYSLYWNSNEDLPANTELKVGFDAGECTAITAVKYVGVGTKQDVVIRTNGGNVTINAENDIVNHYGEIVNLHIKAVAPSSYHEFGTVNFAQVDKGRFVVENEGSVGVAYVESATATLVGENNVAIKLTETDTSAFTKTGDVVTLNYKAYAGKTGYNTVQEAVDAATNGQTVVLLSDVIGNVNIPASKDIVIDFGGHTITSEIMSGTSGFYNLGKVTLKNGTFTHSKDDKNFYLIQNHGTMVMENMSIIGHANSASMVINGKDADGDTATQKRGNLTINNCSLIQKGEFIALKNEFGTCVVNDSILSRENTHNVINAWDNMTLNNCIVTGGIMFGNYVCDNTTTLTINGGTYNCKWIHEWAFSGHAAKLIASNADFSNSAMTAVFGGKTVSEGTLDIEISNSKVAADLSQWLAK